MLRRYCQVTYLYSESAVLCHIVASDPRDVFVYSSFSRHKAIPLRLRVYFTSERRLWINHKKNERKRQNKKREQFSDQQRESKQPMRNTNAATVRVTKEQWRFFGEQEGGRITDRRQEYSTWKDRCVLSHAVDENGRRKALLWKNNHSAHRCYRCGLTIDLYVHMWQ